MKSNEILLIKQRFESKLENGNYDFDAFFHFIHGDENIFYHVVFALLSCVRANAVDVVTTFAGVYSHSSFYEDVFHAASTPFNVPNSAFTCRKYWE